MFAPAHDQQQSLETNVLRFPSFVTPYNREYPLAYPFYPGLALGSHFNRLRLDIIHTHTPFVMGLTGAKMAIGRGIPLVSTFHTLYSQYTHYVPVLPDAMSQGLLEVYLPWYYNRCTEVICPSEVAKQTLVSLGVETPITVIPTGIPLPSPADVTVEARRRVREHYGWSETTPILLFAGRLAEEKHVGDLFEIFNLVRPQVPDVVLALAGDGPDRGILEQKALLSGSGDSIQFLGRTPRSEMDSLFAAADLFCFPSRSETQGLVIGEARAAGTPCVVVDAGGAPETVADGVDGFRIPPDHFELFAEKVVMVLTDASCRRRLHENALRRAGDFTPDRMIEQIVEVYRRAITQPPKDHGLVPNFDGKAATWNIFLPR